MIFRIYGGMGAVPVCQSLHDVKGSVACVVKLAGRWSLMNFPGDLHYDSILSCRADSCRLVFSYFALSMGTTIRLYFCTYSDVGHRGDRYLHNILSTSVQKGDLCWELGFHPFSVRSSSISLHIRNHF